MRVRLMMMLLAAVPVMTACKKKKEEPASAPVTSQSVKEGSGAMTPPPAPTTPPAPTPAPAAGAMNDAQIAAIVVAANQVDIEAGQLAIKKSKNAEVKKFAERMVTDHTAVNKGAVDLVTKLKVTPEESDASKSLTSGGADNRAKLEKLEGDAFDRAYIDNEVAYHEAVIGVLKDKLVPSATNQELKDTLVGVQPTLDAHLQHAKQIQAALAGAPVAHDHK